LKPPKPIRPEVRQRVEQDQDFIVLGHHQNSLRAARERYPDGVPDHIVARALGLTLQQAQMMWANIIRKLRRIMKVEKVE
jgi:hypothetical protein